MVKMDLFKRAAGGSMGTDSCSVNKREADIYYSTRYYES